MGIGIGSASRLAAGCDQSAALLDAIGQLWEIGIDLVSIAIPPSVTIGLVPAGRWRCSERDSLHPSLDAPPLVDGLVRRHRRENLKVNLLAETHNR